MGEVDTSTRRPSPPLLLTALIQARFFLPIKLIGCLILSTNASLQRNGAPSVLLGRRANRLGTLNAGRTLCLLPTWHTSWLSVSHFFFFTNANRTGERRGELAFVQFDPTTRGPALGKPPSKQFPCEFEGCDKTFSREADMQRHAQSHRSGPRTYDCPANRCQRTGLKGFWRIDKLKEHLDSKHPEAEFERWYLYTTTGASGYIDVAKREEHDALMRSREYILNPDYPTKIVYERDIV